MKEGRLQRSAFVRDVVRVACLLALTAVWLLQETTASAQNYAFATDYSFTNTNGDGNYPQSSLILDSAGNLYGTTYQGGAHGVGAVFELVKSSGSYTEQLLYSFAGGSDGAYPFAGLVRDSAGNLYGATGQGGTNGVGTIFELVNSSGSFSEQVLYSFTGISGDGADPIGDLVRDSAGNLYGTTIQGGTNQEGTVFELVNSSGSYTERVLYAFTGSGDGFSPYAGLVRDSAGNLYGTTNQGGTNQVGTVFELVNSSGSYAEQVLYSFTGAAGDGVGPYSGLIRDSAGNLYGTTNSGVATRLTVSVFNLTNSSGSYSEQVLYSFSRTGGDGAGPRGGLVQDSAGNLYGTTQGGGAAINAGTVFELRTHQEATANRSCMCLRMVSMGAYPGKSNLGFRRHPFWN